MVDQVIGSVTIRSQDHDKKRLCDLAIDNAGHIYVIDVENDQKHGKQKYTACIDTQLKEIMKLKKNRRSIR